MSAQDLLKNTTTTGGHDISHHKTRSDSSIHISNTDLLPTIGDASSAIFLLKDYSRFGLAERICYHFDLTEALAASIPTATTTATTTTPSTAVTKTKYNTSSSTTLPGRGKDNDNDSKEFDDEYGICGVFQVLELAPIAISHRLSRRQKRFLRMRLREFNMKAENIHRENNTTICYQPQDLPLRCNPSTKVLFGYEKTRIAFIVDASASLTSTFGVDASGSPSNSNDIGLPLDRLPEMARIFFSSLIEPISTTSTSKSFQPLISVTVLAVYPLGNISETNLLVRDFLVHDVDSAKLLIDRIESWTHSEVECGISERLCRRQAANTWSIPIYSSNLRHILEAGDYALDVLSSEARPTIVVATDGRSISCEGIVDVFLNVDRVDIPIHILDLSQKETHAMGGDEVQSSSSKHETNFLTYDPGGNMGFPLYLTDDSEALFMCCRATGGCFLDLSLLFEAATNTAGQQHTTDELVQQSNSFKRRFVKMNGLQSLVLFSLSPISPTFNSSWGKLAPPSYIQSQLSKSMMEAAGASSTLGAGAGTGVGTSSSASPSDILDLRRHQGSVRQPNSSEQQLKNTQARTTFSTYVVSPVRIKALILTRIKEGYRAKQYGLSTHDADKVFIQFTLPISSGTILHYELSYKALSSENHMIGSAHIKVELSGDPGFIQAVKNDFLHQSLQAPEQRSYTVRQKRSARLCQIFRGIRRGDILQSYLKPPQPQIWLNILASPGSNFVKRLGTLESAERKRHFQDDKFDVVCTGPIPYGIDDNFLSGFMTNQDGRQELIDSVTDWSSQTMTSGSKFLKRCSNSDLMTNYCVVEVSESSKASQLFTVSVEFFGGTDPIERFETISSLKEIINENKYVDVLEKQMAPFLIGNKKNTLLKNDVDIQFHHASWDLVNDSELLSLLSKRRTEVIGGFRLLESRDDYALFAKLEPKTINSPGDLVQYEISVHNDKVVIDLHMESESGVFSPFNVGVGKMNQFGRMVNVIRRRDQECGRALRSRTNLLRVFDEQPGEKTTEEDHRSSVKRILAYSSRVTRKLRFFRFSGEVNIILAELTSELLLSKVFGVKSARLEIDPSTLIRDEEAGVWFIIQYDRQTMSMVHLSLVDEFENAESHQTFRELTFFTIGISDLYSKRDDLADDDSAESHISEHLCVSDFADRFELEQMKNFTLSAYLALRLTSSEDAKIDAADFEEVIQSLQFVEVTSVVVVGAPLDDSSEESKLLRSIKTIICPVPGDEYHFYYSGHSKVEMHEVGEDESGGSSDDNSTTTGVATFNVGEFLTSRDDLSASESEESDIVDQKESVNPPIFIRFHLDGEIASLDDLNGITKSSILSVTVSIFNSSKDKLKILPSSHQGFGLEISALLKSYVAEQTLERFQNTSYSEDNLRLVRKCMAKILSVVSFVIEIHFYISRMDMMMPASAPAGGEAEVMAGFLVLEMELMNNGYLVLQPLADDVFFLKSIIGEESSLGFWCLLKLQRSNGTISSQIYHPDGEEVAISVMSRIHDVLCSCIHITNQQLLLRSLHRTRTVSSLLVPQPVQQSVESSDIENENEMEENFTPGIFNCPVVFCKLFDLFHRAATNPGQVARNLEATVLHNFAVSNRSGIFVYKDETGAIFYMKIEPRGSGIDSDGMVELLVYGIKKPGQEVTEQLRVLLQRRLLLIGVDLLSSVLTKNPHFKWKQADFLFLKSFDDEWKKLEEEKVDKNDHCCYYKFPDGVFDPCMVLLLFRQNLCGSTYFHRLNDIGHDGSTPSPSIVVRDMLAPGGTALKMNEHDFSLYFNNAPSKLDPAFQGLSTLSEKGADYCRKTGAGIAIIEFTLRNGNRNSADDLHFAEPASAAFSDYEVKKSDLRMQQFDDIPSDSAGDSIFIRIKITNTALDRDALNDWIFLTLNQTLVAWVTEKLFERSFHGLLRPIEDHRVGTSDLKQKRLVDALCPGLLASKSIFENSDDLPHSAISRFDNSGVIRSSSVATLALDLLENSILGPLMESKMLTLTDGNDSSKGLLLEKFKSNLSIIRLSRSEKPVLVNLKRCTSDHKKTTVSISSKNEHARIVEDTPIDCPEYICLYTLSERDRNIKSIDSQLRLYREIIIHDGISEKSESIQLLESVKKRSPEAFMRSFAFILSVKRNTRRLWMYNWNPKLVQSIKKIIHEAETSKLADASRASHLLQRRSLGKLSPGFVEANSKSNKKQSSQNLKKTEDSSTQGTEKTPKIEISTTTTGPRRRIRRPTMMRRPKLIGKSVEGAAMQAMAASRQRASTNHFKSKTNPTKGTKLATRPPVNKESNKARPNVVDSSLIRSPAGSQEEETDETLSQVKNDFTRLCSAVQGQSERLSSTQSKARLQLLDIWWPQTPSQIIPLSVANFLLSIAPNAWNDVCALPPLPGGVLDVFIPTFARYLAALTPGLELLPVSSSLNGTNKRIDSLLLCTDIRNIRGTKCCAITRISIIDSSSNRQRIPMVRSEGWILNLRRRSKAAQQVKRHGRIKSSYFTEKDSAGMDKVLTDVHHSLVLESLLFDFSATMAENAVRLLDERIFLGDLVPTVQELMGRYSYERQKRMPLLNYRAFEATIFLKSFRDRLIDMFDSNTLFQRLCLEAEDRKMLRCGNALCLKPVSVKGSHSTCFIALYPNDKTKMKLVLLCRTQDLNLADFMFRERSNIAIHVLDNIAIEASGLALKELHFASECLLKDSLWNSFSSRLSYPNPVESVPNRIPQYQSLDDLLRLVPAHPFLQLPINGSTKKDKIPPEVAFLFGKESGINWLSCCSSMKQNKFFSPNSSTEEKGFINNLFYIERYDVFLMLVVKRDSSLLRADVIEKKCSPEKYQSIFDSVISFIFHYVWRNL